MNKYTILFTVIASIAHAGVSNWPNASEWTPIFAGENYYTDIGHDAINSGNDDENIDIVGNATNSAGFKYVQTENGEEQLLFRIRLDDYKKSVKPLYWQVYFNTDSDADLDFALELESRLDNDKINQWLVSPKVRFTSVSANGTTSAITLSSSNNWIETSGELYARWGGPTPDGDAFIDVAMPATEFYRATGLTSNMPFSIMLATSRTSGLIDGDMVLHDGSVWPPTEDLTLFIPPKPGYIGGISPNTTSQLGGTQIVITGTDLGDGTLSDIQSITLNGIDVASIDSVSSTQIIVTAAPYDITGTGDLVISSTERGITTKENAFTYFYEPPTYTLTVESDHGTPTPAIGTHEFEKDTALLLEVTSPVEIGTTQYVCSGWSMDNDATGSTTSFSTTITNNIQLTWEWSTNYWVNGNGTTTISGWVADGQTINLIPENRDYFKFTEWSGDTSSTNSPLTLTVTQPINISATYKETLTGNTGTPIWWLAEMGYTNNFEEAAMADADADRISNWEEFIAGTDALDEYSKLTLKIRKAASSGHELSWPGIKDREYTIFWGTDLQGSITNTLFENYIPTESGTHYITDPRPAQDHMFYRIVVKKSTEE